MKFGALLLRSRVPEWKDYYLDFNQAKKILKTCIQNFLAFHKSKKDRKFPPGDSITKSSASNAIAKLANVNGASRELTNVPDTSPRATKELQIDRFSATTATTGPSANKKKKGKKEKAKKEDSSTEEDEECHQFLKTDDDVTVLGNFLIPFYQFVDMEMIKVDCHYQNTVESLRNRLAEVERLGNRSKSVKGSKEITSLIEPASISSEKHPSEHHFRELTTSKGLTTQRSLAAVVQRHLHSEKDEVADISRISAQLSKDLESSTDDFRFMESATFAEHLAADKNLPIKSTEKPASFSSEHGSKAHLDGTTKAESGEAPSGSDNQLVARVDAQDRLLDTRDRLLVSGRTESRSGDGRTRPEGRSESVGSEKHFQSEKDRENTGPDYESQIDRTLYNIQKELDKLKDFCKLNYSGYRKIMKKHDKKTGLQMLESVLPFLAETYTFPNYQGELSLLYDQLREDALALGHLSVDDYWKFDLSGKQGPDVYSNVLAFFLGIVTMALVDLLIMLELPAANARYNLKDFLSTFPLFRFSFCLVFMLWVMGWAVACFERFSVNYIFLLNIDPKCQLVGMDLYRYAAIQTIIWITCFATYLFAFKFSPPGYSLALDHYYQFFPTTLLLFQIFILFAPSEVLRRRYRWQILACLVSVFKAPTVDVTFSANIVGDILTSFVKPLADLEYTVCYYSSGTPWSSKFESTHQAKCAILESYFLPIILALPYWFRFLQCLRRLYTSRKMQLEETQRRIAEIEKAFQDEPECVSNRGAGSKVQIDPGAIYVQQSPTVTVPSDTPTWNKPLKGAPESLVVPSKRPSFGTAFTDDEDVVTRSDNLIRVDTSERPLRDVTMSMNPGGMRRGASLDQTTRVLLPSSRQSKKNRKSTVDVMISRAVFDEEGSNFAVGNDGEPNFGIGRRPSTVAPFGSVFTPGIQSVRAHDLAFEAPIDSGSLSGVGSASSGHQPASGSTSIHMSPGEWQCIAQVPLLQNSEDNPTRVRGGEARSARLTQKNRGYRRCGKIHIYGMQVLPGFSDAASTPAL